MRMLKREMNIADYIVSCAGWRSRKVRRITEPIASGYTSPRVMQLLRLS